MMNVVFGKSAQGGLLYAINAEYNISKKRKNPFRGKNDELADAIDKYTAIPVDKFIFFPKEKKGKVICIDFRFDIGYLEPAIDSDYRLTLNDRLVLGDYVRMHPEEADCLYDSGKESYANIQVLKECVKRDVPIRIWYSDFPTEFCGFLHVCSVLRGLNASVSVVHLPNYFQVQGETRHRFSFGQVENYEFAYLLDQERQLSQDEIEFYAKVWDDLVEENAPLRTVIAGVVHSMQEDYFDNYIFSFIPKDRPFTANDIDRDTMYQNHGLVNFGWAKYRLRQLYEAGALELIQDGENQKDIIYQLKK